MRNHSDRPHEFAVTLHAPDGFEIDPAEARLTIDPRREKSIALRIAVPASTAKSVGVITADVAFDRWDLRHWCEALIEVQP